MHGCSRGGPCVVAPGGACVVAPGGGVCVVAPRGGVHGCSWGGGACMVFSMRYGQ